MGWLSAIGTALGGVGGFLVGGPAGAAVGAGIGGSLGGAGEGSKAQSRAFGQASQYESDAINKALEAYESASDEEKKYYEQFLSYMQPYMGLGEKALKGYEKFLTLDPELSPSYQWQKKKFLSELPTSLAPSGLARSGVRSELTAKGLEGMLANESSKIYDRYAGVVNLGYGAAGAVGAGTMQTGANLANLYGGLANIYQKGGESQANIALAKGQAKMGLYRDIGQIPFNALNTYSNYEMMNRLFPVGTLTGRRD